MPHTFSPKKLRISSARPLSWMIQLMGKWAYTARILYWKPCESKIISDSIRSNAANMAYLRYANDHVGNDALERAENSDVLPSALPDSEGDTVGLALHQPDVNIGMPEVLRQCTAGASDSDETGLDSDFNTLWNLEFFGLEDVPHLGRKEVSSM